MQLQLPAQGHRIWKKALTHAKRETTESCPQHGAGAPHAGIATTLHKIFLCHPPCHAQHNVEEEGELRREGTWWVQPT